MVMADMDHTSKRAVDLHLHGVDGFDTTVASVDAILKIAEIEGQAGVSAVVLSIHPGPIETMRARMDAVREAMARQERLSSTVAYPTPAQILGLHLEGPFLNPARAGALDATSFMPPDEKIYRGLIEGFERIVRVITVAPEREGAIPLIRRIAQSGIVVNMGHSNATFAEAEAGFRAGARGITHLFNAMRPFHHREVGLCGFGLLNPDVYVEVIGDTRHVSRQGLELVFRMKKPEKILLVSDSVRETSSLEEQLPTSPEGVLLGGSMTITRMMMLLADEGFDRDRVMKAASENPAAFLRL